MVRLQKLPGKNSHFVTVPHDLRKAMGWEKGTELSFEVKNENELILKEETGNG